MRVGISRDKSEVSLLKAGYVVPRSVRGGAARGGLSWRGLTLLWAGGNCRCGQSWGLVPSRVGGVAVSKLTLHPHLQQLQHEEKRKEFFFNFPFLNVN